jgi:hypothetical protein
MADDEAFWSYREITILGSMRIACQYSLLGSISMSAGSFGEVISTSPCDESVQYLRNLGCISFGDIEFLANAPLTILVLPPSVKPQLLLLIDDNQNNGLVPALCFGQRPARDYCYFFGSFGE